MSRTYIQVELDAFNNFPLIARATGLPVETISHGMLSVWAHCYRHKVSDVRALELRGFFGPCPDLADVLEAFGFVEALPNGAVRIKGVGRYEKICEARREAGRKGGKKSAEVRGPSPRGEKGRFKSPTAEPSPNQVLPSDRSEAEAAPTTATEPHPNHLVRPATEFGPVTEAPGLLRSHSETKPNQMVRTVPNQSEKSVSVAPKPTEALEPRVNNTLSFQENKRESSASGRATPPPVDLSAEKPHTLAKPAPEWPNHECEVAGLAWYAKLRDERPMGHAWTLDDAKRVAMEFPEVFPEAAVEMAEQSKPWVGWKTDLIAWLRRECGFVEAKRKDQARAAKKRADVGPGDRYTPRFRPEPGAPVPVYEPVKPKSYPEPQGRITPSAEWEATWAAARVAVANLLDPDDDEFYLAPLTPLGVSEAGELVLAADSPETRERVVGQVWEGFIAPAVEKALKARRQPPSELRITIRERANARGAA